MLGWRAVLVLTIFVASCGGGEDDRDFRALADLASRPPSTTTTTTTTTPPTTALTTTAPPTTALTTTAPPTTEIGLTPGGPCELGSHPDCIDPDGDGIGTYLLGGGDCMAQFPDSPGSCTDLDLDGFAGYPDSG